MTVHQQSYDLELSCQAPTSNAAVEMEILKSIQVPKRSYFDFFGLKWQETRNLYKVLKLKAECEQATAASYKSYELNSASIFEEGKTLSSYIRVFNTPLKEVFATDSDNRKQVLEKLCGKDGPCSILRKWLKSSANKGEILCELENTTLNLYEGMVCRLQEARKVINKYIERLDLNQTLQGKYGGTLQDKDKPETSVASKKRKRLEVKEAKLRTKVNKSASSYTALIAQEIQSRVHFLETMSTIWQQCETLEQERIGVVVDAYTQYIAILESSEPFSNSREELLEDMRNKASQMKNTLTKKFRFWTENRTGIFDIELYTDNWSFYDIGIVTNDVPMDIPGNLVPKSAEKDSKVAVELGQETKSSEAEESKTSEQQGKRSAEEEEGNKFQYESEKNGSQDSERNESPEDDLHISDVLLNVQKLDVQRSPRTRKDHPMQAPSSGAMIASYNQEVASQEKYMAGHRPVANQMPGVLNHDEPLMDRFKASHTMMGPSPTGHRPPTCPRRTRVPAHSQRVGHISQYESPAPKSTSDRAPKDRSPRDKSSKEESLKDMSHEDKLPRDVLSKDISPKQAPGGDKPKSLPQSEIQKAILQEDLDMGLEVYLLPEESSGARPKRIDCPIKPKINNWTDPNWTDPDLEPLELGTSDHHLLSHFITKSKSKLSKDKKKRNSSPEIKDSCLIPFDFGCDEVDEVSTVICSASNETRSTTGRRAPPTTPGPAQAEGSESNSSDDSPAIPHKRRHHVDAVKMNALEDYEAKDDNEISFSQGRIVKVLRPANDEGMAYGYTRSSRLRKREYGFFPASVVVPILKTSTDPTLSKKLSGFFKRR